MDGAGDLGIFGNDGDEVIGEIPRVRGEKIDLGELRKLLANGFQELGKEGGDAVTA